MVSTATVFSWEFQAIVNKILWRSKTLLMIRKPHMCRAFRDLGNRKASLESLQAEKPNQQPRTSKKQ